MQWKHRSEQRWVDERFLRVACDAISVELDWDSVDSGCLHRATCPARTAAGAEITVGVLDHQECLGELLKDAEQDRREATPLWIYVPATLALPDTLPQWVVLRRLAY